MILHACMLVVWMEGFSDKGFCILLMVGVLWSEAWYGLKFVKAKSDSEND